MKNNFNPTPGPWTISESDPFVIVSESENTDIATVSGWENSDPRQFESNRNLISAALDLLEACKSLRKLHYEKGTASIKGLEATQLADLAISKATGKTKK